MPGAERIQPQPARPSKRSFWAIGHRGFPYVAPENTLSSFEKAIAAGVDMIEFDVTMTRDLVPVVLHDRTLDRTTTGKGSVKRWTYDELGSLDAGRWFSAAFRGERIPALTDVLRLAKGKVALNVEIKMEAAGFRLKGGVEEKVLDALAFYDMGKNTVVSSFFPLVIKRVKRLNPEQSVALLLSRPLKKNPELVADRVGADAIHAPVQGLTESIVQACRDCAIPLRVYTVNEPAVMQKLIKWGVDGIFSDRADRLAAI